jgi:putative Holliday junction resolvase
VRTGRRLAIDVGKVRIGVAASDFHSILASGVATVQRGADLESAVSELVQLIIEIEPIEIYVGYPISLSGLGSSSASDAVALASALASKIDVPIRLIDERLTTVTAANALKTSGRDSKSGRKFIDQIAATVILEQAMEMEKNSDSAPGIKIEEIDE